jgi:hypothetical protein
MNLKKIPKEKYDEVCQAVVNSNINFKKVARAYGVSELTINMIFQKNGSKYIQKSDSEKRITELMDDYVDKQKVFIQMAHDLKIKALKRIGDIIDIETDLDDISKMVKIIDDITIKNKEDEGDEDKGPQLTL